MPRSASRQPSNAIRFQLFGCFDRSLIDKVSGLPCTSLSSIFFREFNPRMSRFLVLYRGGDASKLSPAKHKTLMEKWGQYMQSWGHLVP